MRLWDLIFGWIFTVLGMCALVGVVFYGASWHWFTVGACTLLAWLCFVDAGKRTERRHKEGIGGGESSLKRQSNQPRWFPRLTEVPGLGR